MNTPNNVHIDTTVHPWESCDGDNAWNIAVKSLMTTRREAVADARKRVRDKKLRERGKKWQEEERIRMEQKRRPRTQPTFPLPQLTDDERAAAEHGVRPFTVMDYLFRLRLKTNYEDSNMFADGPENERESRIVRDAICRIAGGTLLLYEIVVRSTVGASSFDQWVRDWIARNLPEKYDGGIVARVQFHRG